MIYVSSEGCGNVAPATMAHLCNHRCVVSMRQKMLPVRCSKIPKSLPRKKLESGYRF